MSFPTDELKLLIDPAHPNCVQTGSSSQTFAGATSSTVVYGFGDSGIAGQRMGPVGVAFGNSTDGIVNRNENYFSFGWDNSAQQFIAATTHSDDFINFEGAGTGPDAGIYAAQDFGWPNFSSNVPGNPQNDFTSPFEPKTPSGLSFSGNNMANDRYKNYKMGTAMIWVYFSPTLTVNEDVLIWGDAQSNGFVLSGSSPFITDYSNNSRTLNAGGTETTSLRLYNQHAIRKAIAGNSSTDHNGDPVETAGDYLATGQWHCLIYEQGTTTTGRRQEETYQGGSTFTSILNTDISSTRPFNALYANGEVIHSNQKMYESLSNGNFNFLGGRGNHLSADNQFRGRIGPMAIWNKILSQKEFEDAYNFYKPRYQP